MARSLTKKDYILIAKPFNEAMTALINQYKQTTDKNDKALIDRQLYTVETLIHALSNELLHDNYRFNVEKFTIACGLTA